MTDTLERWCRAIAGLPRLRDAPQLAAFRAEVSLGEDTSQAGTWSPEVEVFTGEMPAQLQRTLEEAWREAVDVQQVGPLSRSGTGRQWESEIRARCSKCCCVVAEGCDPLAAKAP